MSTTASSPIQQSPSHVEPASSPARRASSSSIRSPKRKENDTSSHDSCNKRPHINVNGPQRSPSSVPMMTGSSPTQDATAAFPSGRAPHMASDTLSDPAHGIKPSGSSLQSGKCSADPQQQAGLHSISTMRSQSPQQTPVPPSMYNIKPPVAGDDADVDTRHEPIKVHSVSPLSRAAIELLGTPGSGDSMPIIMNAATTRALNDSPVISKNAPDQAASPNSFQFTAGPSALTTFSAGAPHPAPAPVSQISPAGQSANDRPASFLPKGKISGRVNPPGTGGHSLSRGDGGAGGAGSAKNKKAKRVNLKRASQASNGQANDSTAAGAPAVSETKPSTKSDSPGDHAKATPPPNARKEQPLPHADVPYQVPPRPLTPFRNPEYPAIDLQPRTRAISLPQLVNEVKGIYVGLAMVESKCIEIDNEQSANKDPNNKLDTEQWQALMALHRTLLHEHHDFMLASQHPSASPALRRVAQKYAMPARMWRHGIHSFLELLRHRLPDSREHMITFIYTAYSIIALLYESVDAFRDTWVECLGDLSRYRMAIEDDNQRVRDTWTIVSRRWYSLASDHSPSVGRLYHHLAILARPSLVTQMFYYVKSLCVLTPFASTHESIKTLLEPLLRSNSRRGPSVETDFTKVHAILFVLTGTAKPQRSAPYQADYARAVKAEPEPEPEAAAPQFQGASGDQLKALHASYAKQFPTVVDRTLAALDEYLAKHQDWVQRGTHMAILNSCALLGYGRTDNVLLKLLNNVITHVPLIVDDNAPARLDSRDSVDSQDGHDGMPTLDDRVRPHYFVSEMDKRVFKQALVAKASHGYIHARLVWMLSLARLPGKAMAQVEGTFPWTELVAALNEMLLTCMHFDKIEQELVMKPVVSAEDRQAQLLADIAARKEEEQCKQQAIFEQQLERIRREQEQEQQQQQQQQQQKKKKLESLVVDASNGKGSVAVAATTVTAAPAASAAPAVPAAPAAPVPARAPVMPAVPPEMPQPAPLLEATPSTSTRKADDETKPIPDDWALRGLIWTENYYPKDWFTATDSVDDDEKLLEAPSVALARQDRILWLGCRLAAFEKWILYDATNHQFSVAPAFVRAPSSLADNDKPDLAMEDAPSDGTGGGGDKPDLAMEDAPLEATGGTDASAAVDTEAHPVTRTGRRHMQNHSSRQPDVNMKDIYPGDAYEASRLDDDDDIPVPGLDSDDDGDSVGDRDGDSINSDDTDDDDANMTDMQRLADNTMDRFNRAHPPTQAPQAGGPTAAQAVAELVAGSSRAPRAAEATTASPPVDSGRKVSAPAAETGVQQPGVSMEARDAAGLQKKDVQ